MSPWLAGLLIVAAALAGYALASWRRQQGEEQRVARVSRSYFRGLSLLLEEQTDEAIQAFLEVEDKDADTVETQLALGSLFRRRGEVDRAIRLHLQLFERPGLSAEQRGQALYELGEDYLRAGLLDRAEALYEDLLQIQLQPGRALKALLTIFEQEQDWHRAIRTAERLADESRESMALQIAHYHCELALKALADGDREQLSIHVRQAQKSDPRCARAHLVEAEAALAAGENLRALEALVRAAEIEPAVVPEAMPLWRRAAADQSLKGAVEATLKRLVQIDPGVAAVLVEAERLAAEQGLAAAEALLAERLVHRPSMPVLQRMLSLDARIADPTALQSKLAVAAEVLARAIDATPGYRCSRCGFQARAIHWQCPSCKSWSSVKPAPGHA